MSKRPALGGDALDALIPGSTTPEEGAPPAALVGSAAPTISSRKTQALRKGTESQPSKASSESFKAPSSELVGREVNGELHEESGSTTQPTRREGKGRPRGAAFGQEKGTRWRRADGEAMRARSFHLPQALDERLRRRAAEEDRPIGAVIVEALEKFLG